MTVRINFLPRTYQPPKRLGAKDWAIAASVAALAVSTTVFYMGTYASTARIESQLLADQTELQGVRAKLAQAADTKAREEGVAKAEAQLKGLVGRQWSPVLLVLRDLTPLHVSWTSLSVEGNNITLKALGHGLVDVAQLFGGLVDLTQVERVTLRYVNEAGTPVSIAAQGGDKNVRLDVDAVSNALRQLEFELVITLVPPEGGQMPNGA